MYKLIRRFMWHSKMSMVETLTMLRSAYIHKKYSFKELSVRNDPENLKYYILKRCHIVEKGLSLPETRPGFGQPKILELIQQTEFYRAKGDPKIVQIVHDTLEQYLMFHKDCTHILSPRLLELSQMFLGKSHSGGLGGITTLTKDKIKSINIQEFGTLLRSRKSVRQFSDQEVDLKELNTALSLALHTPSVCNRQGWKIHVYSKKDQIQTLLKFQNGNRGFSEEINKLLIITGNTKAFTIYEHNQLYIDSGLISMNVMLALHCSGLGSCPLNLCLPYKQETLMVKAAQIPEYERPIMMIGVGVLKNEFEVAQSERLGVESVISQH